VELQNYSLKSSVTWTPTWTDLGPHVIQVWARTVGSPAQYEAWVSTDEFTVNANPVQVSADVDFPTPPGNPVHWVASIAGADTAQLEYRYIILNQTTGVWAELRPYDTDPAFTWTPTTIGKYVVQVWARKVGSAAPYDVWGNAPSFNIARTALTVSSLTVDRPLPTTTGTTMTWTARVKGGTQGPFEYRFIRYSAATGWQEVQPYSGSNSYVWTPTWGEHGKYHFQVWVRNAGSTAEYDAWKGTSSFDVNLAPMQIELNHTFPVPPGTAVTLTAQVADTEQTLEYRFVQYDRGTGTWSEARPYGTSNTYTWTPRSTGTFLFQAWARRVGSTAEYEVWRGTDYLPVALGPAHLISLISSRALPGSVGTPITWTATANGGFAAPLQYRFIMYTEGEGWTELGNWSSSNTLTWTPTSTDVGRHEIQVWVRSAGSSAEYEGWLSSPFFDIEF
jgi:alpha-amylase